MDEFCSDPDPFNLELLGKTILEVKRAIKAGILADYANGEMGNLPRPTHSSAEVPYDRDPGGRNLEVVWLGVIRDRNLKELFELHHSKTGEHLDPSTVKDPGLNEWVVMLGEDDTDLLTITVDRWRYNQFRQAIWSIGETDLVLIRGHKKGFQSRRAIYVTDMWVLATGEE